MKKKYRKRYYQYLPKHLLRAVLLAILVLYVFLEAMYWIRYDQMSDYLNTYTYAHYHNVANMLQQASLKEQPADFLKYLSEERNQVKYAGFGAEYYGYCALVDSDTWEVYMDTEPPITWLTIKGWQEDFINPTYRGWDTGVFYCQDEAVQKVWEQTEAYCRQFEEICNDVKIEGDTGSSRHCSVNAIIKDFYIQEGTDLFLPGKIEVIIDAEFTSYPSGTTREERQSKEFDFTPSDTTGLIHYNASDFEDCKITADQEKSWEDYNVRKGVKEEALSKAKNMVQNPLLQVERLEVPHPWIAFIEGNMEKCIISSLGGRDMKTDGKNYYLVQYWKKTLPFALDYESIDAVVWIPILFLLGSFAFAAIDFFINRFKFMTEDYRKALMDSMAHDLKSPLMAISGYAENLKENIHEEKREYYAGEILNTVGYMDGIIQRNLELLNYNRFQKPLQKTQVDVKKVCEKLFDNYKLEMEKKNLKVLYHGEMTAKADAYLLERALDNLISNAVKYSLTDSEIHLCFSKYELRVENKTELEFKGSLSRLWEPLVRGDESRTEKGTGLGLSIASHIFERHKWNYKLIYKKEEQLFICKIKIPIGLMF